MNNERKLLYTVKEVSNVLGVNVHLIYRLGARI